MSPDTYIPFLIATLILLATPGPTILMVVSYALARGRTVALAVVAGVILGDLLAMTATLLGLGFILATSALAFTIMKWAGAAYLVWMGLRMINAAHHAIEEIEDVAARSNFRAFRDSLVVTLLNPKSIGFFIAFVPQFVDASRPVTPQFTIMTITFVSLGGVNALAYALLAGQLRQYVKNARGMAWLQRVGGGVLIGLAIMTATLRRH